MPDLAQGEGVRVYSSVLFDGAQRPDIARGATSADYFIDLNLDQVVAAVTGAYADYDLKPIFQSPLQRTETILYRHEVFEDLQNPKLRDDIKRFTKNMRDVRVHSALSAKLHNKSHKEMWFVHAVEVYCAAVEQLASDLDSRRLKSRGFIAVRDYVASYVAGADFLSLRDKAKSIAAELARIEYNVLIGEDCFTVENFHDEADYSAEIEATFQKFKQGAATDYVAKFDNAPENMNHIEAKVLEFVARLNPAPFGRLSRYCDRHANFLDGTIATFDREVQFYVSYLDQAAKLERAGLHFCLPEISDTSKAVHCREGFDLALALKLVAAGKPVVCNSFGLKGQERIIVVSGPNQGGKTTFARMVGQLHYLASLGCPVPGRKAQLLLFDRLFTHFEREERVENLRGKLEDDLIRVHAILERATARSVIVLNEIFTSTTIQDETFLSRRVMERVIKLDVIAVWVTFVDELARIGPQVASMTSMVLPDQPATRTFKIERRPADGLAYAMAIAQKYNLTYDRVKERIRE